MAEVRPPRFFQTQQRWALGLCCLLILGPLLFVVWLNSPEQLVPRAGQRFDVEEVWLGAMRELCPGSEPSPTTAAIEQCLSTLSIAKAEDKGLLQRVALPSVAQSPLLGFPDLPRLMRQQGLDSLKLSGSGGPTLLGMRIPTRLFKENRIGKALQALVVAQLGDARICYHGRCPYFADTHTPLGARFPLMSQGHEQTEGTVDVWIIASAGPLAEAINLKQGLFVALIDDLRTMDNIGTPMVMGGNITSSAVLLGMAMIVLLCAWLWAEYLDFAAFAVLINLQFFSLVWTTASMALGLDREAPQLVLIGRAFLLVQVALAFIAVACATLRPRPQQFWPAWAFAGFALGAVVLSLVFSPLDFPLHSLEHITASIQLVLPPAIATVGAMILRRIPASTPELQKAHGVAIARRLREQVIMAFCLLLAALPDYLATAQPTPDHMPSLLRLAGTLAILPAFGALLYSAGGKFRSRSETYRNDLIAMAKQAAVGEMIQMLAHDVRKPFSLLRIGLQVLLGAKNHEDMRVATQRLVPQVKKSIASVHAMLEDVRAVNMETNLTLDVVIAESLITQCLNDVIGGRPDLDVSLSYAWRHQHLLAIDSLKILRVLNNIVDNAIQATKGSCRLWFHTEERLTADGRAWLDLVIGNSGSIIPADQLETIFAAFFTRGKASGTGLGLAVARKFVTLHGGSIQCRSDALNGTEFLLTLPLAAAEATPTATGLPQPFLPGHSSQLSDAMIGIKETVTSAFSSPLNEREEGLLRSFLRAVAELSRPLTVLLVEHRPLYAAAFTSVMEPLTHHAVDDAPAVRLLQASHHDEAYAQTALHEVDLVLIDADLALVNNMELITNLNSGELVTTLGILAEPSFPAEDRRTLSSSVNHIVPQPLPREAMLDILTTAANTAIGRLRQRQPAAAAAPPRTLPAAVVPELVIVADDDIFIREIWQQTLQPTASSAFAAPETLIAWLEGGGSLQPIACFVLDLHFDEQSKLDGLQLAQAVRRLSSAPILLSTDALITLEANSPITAVIPKEPASLDALLGYIALAKKPSAAG